MHVERKDEEMIRDEQCGFKTNALCVHNEGSSTISTKAR